MTLNNKPPLGEEYVRTNFELLDMDYAEIMDIVPGAVTAFPAYRSDVTFVQSKRIIFTDSSYLTVVEMSNDKRELLQYYYEWYNPSRILIMKFHAHYHSDDTPEDISKFDPFHLHKKENTDDLKLTVRVPNEDMRNIRQIINYILHSQYVVKYY